MSTVFIAVLPFNLNCLPAYLLMSEGQFVSNPSSLTCCTSYDYCKEPSTVLFPEVWPNWLANAAGKG